MGISPRPESAEGLRDASAAICLLGILGGDAMEPWLVAARQENCHAFACHRPWNFAV
jgi:hypothetical protein